MVKHGMAITALFLAVALTFSGCSFVGLDPQTLMHAPKPTGENEADIQSLLDHTAAGQFALKYPAAGEYRSAILKHNLCGDATDEAIAFYQQKDEVSATHIVFMQKQNGTWKNIGAYTSQAAQVDRVCFGDVNGDGRDEAIVGWGSSLNNNGAICVYSYNNGSMAEQKLSQSYTELAVMDFDGDGKDEIFTASVTNGDRPAAARLLRIKDGGMEVLGTAPLDTGVTKYDSMKTGLVNEKQKGIVLDGVKTSDTMVTELLYWDAKAKKFCAPFYDATTKTAKSTQRNTTVVSKDINGDRIIEIPIVTLMPGYSGITADEADYLTNWHRYDTSTNTFVRVMSMVVNSSDGYWFAVPDIWRGAITTKLDPSTRSFSFFEWKKESGNAEGKIGAQLLKIEVFTRAEWNRLSGSGGYFEIESKDNIVFAAKVPSPDSRLSLTEDEVKNAFRLISRD